MNLETLVMSIDSLRKLSEIELSAKVSFRISRFLKSIEPTLESFEKSRSELLNKYGDTNEETGMVTFSRKEQKEKFDQEIKDLLAEEIDVQIPELDITDLGEASIKPNVLMTLDWLFHQEY